MTLSTDVYKYQLQAEHLTNVYSSSVSSGNFQIEELQRLMSKVDQAYVNAAHAARTETEKRIVLETKGRLDQLLSGTPPDIDLVAIINETLAVLKQDYYVSPNGTVHNNLKEGMQLAAQNVELFIGGRAGQRPGNYPTQIIVMNQDCLYAAEKLKAQGKNPLVLNLANAQYVGGGYKKGARAQEEDLFRRSTYPLVLDKEHGLQEKNYYPLNEYPGSKSAGLYVPYILVIRAGKDKGYAFLDNPFYVASSVVAAQRKPTLITKDGKPRLSDADAAITRERVCTILEMGYQKRHQSLVLGALGCGAFQNPPDHVVEIFLDVIRERYAHCFEIIVFAILEDDNSRRNNSEGNFIPFARQVIRAGGIAINEKGEQVSIKESV